MAFQWEKFLGVAQVVASDVHPTSATDVSEPLASEDTEARYRIAISRAYYASLGVCHEYIVKNDPMYSLSGKHDEHTEIHDFFINKTRDLKLREVGVWLDILRKLRRQSDYKLGQLDDGKGKSLSWPKETSKALKLSGQICQRCGVWPLPIVSPPTIPHPPPPQNTANP